MGKATLDGEARQGSGAEDCIGCGGQALPDLGEPGLVFGLHEHGAEAGDEGCGIGLWGKPICGQANEGQMEIARGAGIKYLLG